MPDSTSPIRWGILGPGGIAHAFARDLPQAENARLVAVASRSKARAEAFGAEYGLDPARCLEGYAALAADPEVDAVYVATPHPMHFEDTLLCLRSGKAVLCEKPLTLNAGQAQTLVDTAREAGTLLVEAMWTRWIPAVARARELVRAGTIGEVQLVTASFGIHADHDPQHRLFNPALGGGALLDLGVYPVSFASMILGDPETVQASGHLTPEGVDDQVGLLLGHSGGRLAVLTCASRTETRHEAIIYGSAGHIEVGPPFFHARQLTLSRAGQEPEVMSFPFEGGYQFEANEVGRLLRAGATESEVMPLNESVAVMRTLDRARAQLGVQYPGEEARA